MAASTNPEKPWFMTTSADAKLAKLEERVEGQGRTLSRIDNNLNKIAGVLESVAIQTTKLEHISLTVDEMRRRTDEHDKRMSIGERELHLLQQAVNDIDQDVRQLAEAQARHGRRIDRHAPVVAAAMFLVSAIVVSGIGTAYALITDAITISFGG